MCLNVNTNAFPTLLSVAVTAHVTLFTMTAMYSRNVKSADDYVTIHKMAAPYRGNSQPCVFLFYAYLRVHILHYYI
jgi:hypothetical protein